MIFWASNSIIARISGVVLLSVALAVQVQAEEGSAFNKETVLQMSQLQFEQMYDKALAESKSELEKEGAVFPFAVAMGQNSDPKAVRIKQEQVPTADAAVLILRRSLKVMFAKGKVGATTLIYTASSNEDSSQRLLVMEMEHIFGPSVTQVTPYKVEAGQVKFGTPVAEKGERKIFTVSGSVGQS